MKILYLCVNASIVLAVTCSASRAGIAGDLPLAQRSQAVEATAARARLCRDLGSFYWEIGNANGKLAAGAVGSDYTPDKPIAIASASKWVFGAYVLEKIGRDAEPSPEQLRQLEMQSGHTSLNHLSCVFARTVGACLNRRNNAQLTAAAIGKFSYNGGHDQQLAVDLGLGDLDSAAFAAEIRNYLGKDLDFAFNSPQPAGGMRASPATYARFLQKIVNGELRMQRYLGSHPVCTLPGACTNALESPVPLAWHYSLNHWIEDDPQGDGAFSSPGAFGFYPWISADQHWYGILARESHRPLAYRESVYCGEKLRKAWISGNVQGD